MMKVKIKTRKLLFVLTAILVINCVQAQDAVRYSSDEKTDAWIKENLSEIQQMSREDWLQLNDKLKIPTYVVFSPEKKHSFWLQKIQEVLSLDWNEKEKKHIESLYKVISSNPQWFNDDFNAEQAEDFQTNIGKWTKYATDSLGWDMRLTGSIVATPNKLVDKNGTLELNDTPQSNGDFPKLNRKSPNVEKTSSVTGKQATVEEEFSVFEKNFAATVSSDEKEIKLIGYATFPIKPEDREKFKEAMKNHAGEKTGNNMYFAEDYSSYRMYFPFHTAIIDCEGVQYTANEKSIVSIPGSVDVGKIKVIGRKRSATVQGTGSNIIEEDRIILKEELKQDGISSYSYPKERICVFAMSGWSM
jgi:hypothetical protein